MCLALAQIMAKNISWPMYQLTSSTQYWTVLAYFHLWEAG